MICIWKKSTIRKNFILVNKDTYQSSYKFEITLQKAQNACVISNLSSFGWKYAILRQLYYLPYTQRITQTLSVVCPKRPAKNIAFTRSLWPFWHVKAMLWQGQSIAFAG